MHFIENIRHYPMFVVGALIFLSAGVITLVWTRRIQQYAIQWHERHPVIARFNLFRRRIYGEAYLFELRLCGALSFLAGIVCCWILWTGK
jgi:hypothetical protein